MNHILSDFLSDTCNSLENLRRNNVYKEFYYHIKCENLEDFLSKDITQSVQYQNLFQDLMQIKDLYYIGMKLHLPTLTMT